MGGPQKSKPKRRAKRSTQKANANEAQGAGCVDTRPIVTLISCRVRLIEDEDNLIGGSKALRDEVAKSLGLDDSDAVIEWRYYQTKVSTRKEEGTLVKIEI
ncbi:MAG: hypothetical protein AAF546_00135 [Verrucomicrobiota bacterium]